MDIHQKIANTEYIYLDTSVLIKIYKEEDKSNIVRSLVYGTSGIKFYSSFVGFGEFIGKIGRKEIHDKIGSSGFIFNCRMLMQDFDYKKIKRVEPTEDSKNFIKTANDLLEKYSKIGGADIWHILSMLELQRLHNLALFLSFDRKLVNIANLEDINAINGYNVNLTQVINELKLQKKWLGN